MYRVPLLLWAHATHRDTTVSARPPHLVIVHFTTVGVLGELKKDCSDFGWLGVPVLRVRVHRPLSQIACVGGLSRLARHLSHVQA